MLDVRCSCSREYHSHSHAIVSYHHGLKWQAVFTKSISMNAVVTTTWNESVIIMIGSHFLYGWKWCRSGSSISSSSKQGRVEIMEE